MKTLLSPIYANDAFRVYGSMGMAKGLLTREGNAYTYTGEDYTVSAVDELDAASGVTLRKSTVKNTGDEVITLTDAAARFVFDGGEWEVYTQSNTWQNESTGGWVPLVTEVRAESDALRNAFGAAPMLALYNKQTARGVVFHIVPRAPWALSARIAPRYGGEAVSVWVEAGYNPTNFAYALGGGESLSLPEVIYYEFRNKTDLDAYRLHRYMNAHFPRRYAPVAFNTWLQKFEKIDFENVSAQIDRASEMGFDYFVTDAAWYGGNEGNFWEVRGDWSENTTGAYAGRMGELAERVRAAGMQFGLWLELESAGDRSRVLAEHPEYYFRYEDGTEVFYFFDFASEAAREYLFTRIDALIRTYGVAFLKLDFNQDLRHDKTQGGFIRHLAGYEAFLLRLKAAHPSLYIEDCSGGGQRTSLSNCMVADGFWMSDNQSTYEGMRIFRDTVKRLPPQAIEKWATVTSLSGFEPVYLGADTSEKILTCNDAIWNDVRGVHLSYLDAFLFGSPMGFSCDLTAFSPALVTHLKERIAAYHAKRDFWLCAECRILAETGEVTVLQFADKELSHIEIVAAVERIRQSSLTVYPVVDKCAKYRLEDKELSGAEIDECGITLPFKENFSAGFIVLDKA
ncbi:MAG: alpha-galactosidase [Clostridia bacterium]|nr:alpha-galactosidase [Clostridia bacterium]